MNRPPMNVYRYATFCAPTTLAALLDVSPLEAAEYLTAQGCNSGTGGTQHWGDIVKSFGGQSVEVKRPDGRERFGANPKARIWADHRAWFASFYYTTTQFLREHSTGTYVLASNTHTFLARNGKVVADTQRTKSARARITEAYYFSSL